jgi:hypothetical protein
VLAGIVTDYVLSTQDWPLRIPSGDSKLRRATRIVIWENPKNNSKLSDEKSPISESEYLD